VTGTSTMDGDRSVYPSRVASDPDVIARRDPVVYGTVDDGPLTAEQLAAYDARGFHHNDQLIGAEDVLRLEEAVSRLVDDPALLGDERVIRERGSDAVRSVFEVHRLDTEFAALAADPRIVDPVRQILGSDVYVHQSRVNLKPGFTGRDFYWHSDFETWHAEDGMPRMRALSVSVSLTENHDWNGSLMVIPGSHLQFVGCAGETPDGHYQHSLKAQEYGVPSREALTRLVAAGGIHQVTGPPGSAVMFDCNVMHGSNGNITPFARRNVFLVYNSVENALVEPFAAPARRPDFIASRVVCPVAPSPREH
jgi:ectoine hydroxylase